MSFRVLWRHQSSQPQTIYQLARNAKCSLIIHMKPLRKDGVKTVFRTKKVQSLPFQSQPASIEVAKSICMLHSVTRSRNFAQASELGSLLHFFVIFFFALVHLSCGTIRCINPALASRKYSYLEHEI